jgi:hypothetical protein
MVDAVVADARKLLWPDKHFDVVYSNAVIEHVGDEAPYFQAILTHIRHPYLTGLTPSRISPRTPYTNNMMMAGASRKNQPRYTTNFSEVPSCESPAAPNASAAQMRHSPTQMNRENLPHIMGSYLCLAQ